MTKLTGKYQDVVFQYAHDCLDGKIPANHYRKLACQRFLDDYESDQWDWRPGDADFVIKIIEGSFCHQQGENQQGEPLRGTPFYLQDWQKFVIYGLLAFYEKGTQLKRVKEALIYIPRKNAKTTFAAALAYGLGLLYRKSGAKIYIAAAALKQTLESFQFIKYNVKTMGEWDEEGGHFHVIDNNAEHSIRGEIGGGFLEINALASNPDAQDSLNGNIAICDEIHAFKKPKQYNLFKEMMKAYSNKLMIGISTAGDDPNCFLAQRLIYCKRVLDGEVRDDQYFVFICEADLSKADDGSEFLDFTNPDVQAMANPSIGQSIRPEDLESDALQALHDPQQRKDFFAKSLNVFSSALDAYFDMGQVTASDSKYRWTLEELARLPIKWYGGADLSKMHDLTGACIYGRYQGVDIAITHGFCPRGEAARKVEEDHIPVHWWEDSGWLTICNGEVIEMEDVVQWYIKLRDMGFSIRWVGYDRRYAREFVMKMKKAGFKMRDQMQRYVEKTEAFREIEKRIRTGRFYYLHSRAFEYCIQNVKAVEDSDEFIRFEKVMPKQRIDLFDCTVIACKQLLIGHEKDKSSAGFFGG